MITIEDLKEEFRIDASDTSQDEFLGKILNRVQNYIKGYTNNWNINFDDSSDLENFPIDEDLDEIILFLCVRAYNPDTRFRAGKESENMGASITFSKDLPDDYKRILKTFRKLNFS